MGRMKLSLALAALLALAACDQGTDGAAEPPVTPVPPEGAAGPAAQAPAPEPPPDGLTILTESGPLRGVIENGVRTFRAIPYAAPPVGALRFSPPRRAASWEGVREAAEFGPICPQPRDVSVPEDEDCLTLNIWTPEGAEEGRRLPVLFWIHGGAFVSGSGRIDASAFARDGVVAVTINYRLGRLGVFAHPELGPDGGGAGGINFGLLDQIAALKWVERNIEAFGGDPQRITIAGVSAGAGYVNLLMSSPLAEGLFSGAIAQSGANGFAISRRVSESFAGQPSLEDLGVAFAESAGVSDAPDVAAALRALPWQAFVKNQPPGPYREASSPVVDGLEIPDDPGTVFSLGQQHMVPYIAGANSFEGSLSAAIPLPVFEEVVKANPQEISQAYGVAADDPKLPLLLYGDYLFVAPTRYLVGLMAEQGAPAWSYFFGYVRESFESRLPGAFHGGEVPYVFDIIGDFQPNRMMQEVYGIEEGVYPPTARDLETARIMHAYWVNFVRTGDPNGEDLPAWPGYAEDAATLVVLPEAIRVESNYRKAILDRNEESFHEQATAARGEVEAEAEE
ncbi:MAG: carboxylesterase family protein [Alphaproteobacteria bacterium]|nr:carboxylesterase family protein [Alphaproteobacteria bacterium]